VKQQMRFAWAAATRPEKSAAPPPIDLDPSTRARIVELMAQILVAVVRDRKEASDDR
jgi:hypothetical protein